jgi:hypothetical protein
MSKGPLLQLTGTASSAPGTCSSAIGKASEGAGASSLAIGKLPKLRNHLLLWLKEQFRYKSNIMIAFLFATAHVSRVNAGFSSVLV